MEPIKVKRILYLLYYVKELSWEKVGRFERIALAKSGKHRVQLWWDVAVSVFKYNVSILDYFYFRFYLPETDRQSYAGTGFMYEYQLRMNPRGHRRVLEDKLKFAITYREFINRRIVAIRELKANPDALSLLWNNGQERLVAKYSRGQVGAEVQVLKKSSLRQDSFLDLLLSSGFDMVEEYVVQHSKLAQLSNAGLNTVRVISQLHHGHVEILAARLRITVDSEVDNMAAGNLAAAIDLRTGVVTGPGVYSDITRPEEIRHPRTGEMIVGFKVPRWDEVLDLVHRAATVYPENRSVGWDVAITEDGVQLIEGNHNWCKLLWQLPVKQGLKQNLYGSK